MKRWLVVLLVFLVGCAAPAAYSPGQSFCAEGYKQVNDGCVKINQETAPAKQMNKTAPVTAAVVAEPTETTNQTAEFATGFVNQTATNPMELLPALFAKIDSYGYELDRNQYAVVGSKVRVFYNTILNIGAFRVNTIYFDNQEKTAVGMCIPDRYFIKRGLHTQCDELGNTQYELDFKEWYEKTPGEYLQEFSTLRPADIIEFQGVDNRDAYLFIFRDGEKYQNFWADYTYGMPLRIEWYEGSDRIKAVEFKDLIVNDFALDDVTP